MKRLAFPALPMLLAASIASAQTDTVYRQQPSTKSTGAAVALSFVIPGLGQAYADEPERGAVFAILAAGGAIVGGYNLQRVTTCTNGRLPCETGPRSSGLGVGGVAVSVISWLASMLDAPNSVHRYNEKHHARVSIVPVGRSLGVGVAFAP